MRPKKSNKTSRTLGVRFIPEDAKLMAKVCETRGEDLSDFVRRSVRKELARLGYLTKNEEKTLGVLNEGN